MTGILAAGIIESLITPAVVAVITGVISSTITIAVLRVRISAVEQHARDHEKRLGRLEVDRPNCELRAAHTYATRAETGRILVETAHQYESLGAKIDKGLDAVHGRITSLQTDVAKMSAASGDQ